MACFPASLVHERVQAAVTRNVCFALEVTTWSWRWWLCWLQRCTVGAYVAVASVDQDVHVVQELGWLDEVSRGGGQSRVRWQFVGPCEKQDGKDDECASPDPHHRPAALQAARPPPHLVHCQSYHWWIMLAETTLVVFAGAFDCLYTCQACEAGLLGRGLLES